MASRTRWPPPFALLAGLPRVSRTCVLFAFGMLTGCSTRQALPPEGAESAMLARMAVPAEPTDKPGETAAGPGEAVTLTGGTASVPVEEVENGAATLFSLPDAIAFALQNNPRLRSA